MNLIVTIDQLQLIEFDAGGGEIFKYNGQYFTGTLVEYYSNGNICAEEEFVDGHKNGIQKTYYENGLIEEEYYKRFNGFYGTYKRWDSSGNLIVHGTYDDNSHSFNWIIGPP